MNLENLLVGFDRVDAENRQTIRATRMIRKKSLIIESVSHGERFPFCKTRRVRHPWRAVLSRASSGASPMAGGTIESVSHGEAGGTTESVSHDKRAVARHTIESVSHGKRAIAKHKA